MPETEAEQNKYGRDELEPRRSYLIENGWAFIEKNKIGGFLQTLDIQNRKNDLRTYLDNHINGEIVYKIFGDKLLFISVSKNIDDKEGYPYKYSVNLSRFNKKGRELNHCNTYVPEGCLERMLELAVTKANIF